MPELLQHIVVTVVAFGAAFVVVQRVFSVVQPVGGNPKCASCPSNPAHAARPAQPQPADIKPLTFVR
jgi:hypothetical protein